MGVGVGANGGRYAIVSSAVVIFPHGDVAVLVASYAPRLISFVPRTDLDL
jgi:hypothetical protein